MPMVPAATAPSQPRLPRRRNKQNRISVRLRAGVLCFDSVHFHPSPRHFSNPHRTVPGFFPSPLSTQRHRRRLRPTAQSPPPMPRARLVTCRGTPTRGRIRGTTPLTERPGLGLSRGHPPLPEGEGGFTAQQAGPAPAPHPPPRRVGKPGPGQDAGAGRDDDGPHAALPPGAPCHRTTRCPPHRPEGPLSGNRHEDFSLWRPPPPFIENLCVRKTPIFMTKEPLEKVCLDPAPEKFPPYQTPPGAGNHGSL